MNQLRSKSHYEGASTAPPSSSSPVRWCLVVSKDSPSVVVSNSSFRLAPLSVCLEVEVDLCNSTFVSIRLNSLETSTSCRLYELPSAQRVIGRSASQGKGYVTICCRTPCARNRLTTKRGGARLGLQQPETYPADWLSWVDARLGPGPCHCTDNTLSVLMRAPRLVLS